jgi:hypothetical protein
VGGNLDLADNVSDRAGLGAAQDDQFQADSVSIEWSAL